MASGDGESMEGTVPLTLSLNGDFRGRTQLVKLIRQAVIGLLVDAGCDREAQSSGMIVAQELAENLVKYSRSAHTSLTAAVRRLGAHQAQLVLDTSNDASGEEVSRVRQLLDEVESTRDPHSLYQERIASSSTRTRSELGLLRILAEGAMDLELEVEGERVHLHVRSSTLNVGTTPSANPKPIATSRRRESLR